MKVPVQLKSSNSKDLDLLDSKPLKGVQFEVWNSRWMLGWTCFSE